MMSKNIIVDLNKGKKLDGENYDIWHCKIQYLLDEQEVLETWTQSMEAPQRRAAVHNTDAMLRPLQNGPRKIVVRALLC